MRETTRREWLDAITRRRVNPDRPGNDRYWAESLECMSRDELAALQSEKLRLALLYVYHGIPFYRRKFDRIGLQPGDIRDIGDLAKIPLTTKQEMSEDLAEHPPWGTYTAVDDTAWLEHGWQLFATSGTTGAPRAFRYTAIDREIWAWANARALWAMGLRPGRDSLLIAFGYGPHVWLWGMHYAANLMGLPIVTAGGLDSRMRARFIDQYRPTVLCCTPSYALYLASVLQESGVDPAATSIRALLCAGEPGYAVPATRRALEETWGAELHESYGCTEAAPCAGGFTCVEGVRRKEGDVWTHLFEDGQVWETVVPETLASTEPGERGLSVVTNLCSEASPQLRFLIGDFTTLSRGPCECGRTHVRAMGGFRGRADDMLNVRGVTLFPTSIEDAVRRIPEAGTEYEIVLTTNRNMDVLTVRVEARSDAGRPSQAELSRRVESEIIAACELRPVVEVLPFGTLPRAQFKAKRVRDERVG